MVNKGLGEEELSLRGIENDDEGKKEDNDFSCSSTLRGYKVVVLIAAFVCSFVDGGLGYTVSIYYVSWIDEFEAGSGITSWLGSILHGVTLVTAALSSQLTKRYGFRPVVICGGLLMSLGLVASSFAASLGVLILTYSIITPIGIGLMVASYFPIVSLYFTGRGRILANGLFTTGAGFATVVMPYLLYWCIETYHWRGSMYIFAGITLQICICGALMREPPFVTYSRRKESIRMKPTTLCATMSKIIKNSGFMLYLAHIFFNCIGLSVVYVHITAYTETVGLVKREKATLALFVLGLFGLAGRIVTGLTSQFKIWNPYIYYISCLSLSGLFTILVTLFSHFEVIITWSALLGFFMAPYTAMMMIMTLKFVALSDLETAFAFINMTGAFGYSIGAPCAGWLFDGTADYRYSFYLGGSMILFGCLILTIPLYWQLNGSKKTEISVGMD